MPRQRDINLISLWTLFLVGLPAFFPYSGTKVALQIIIVLAIGFTLPSKLTLIPTICNWIIFLLVNPLFQTSGLIASLSTGLFGFNSAYILAAFTVSRYLSLRQKDNRWKYLKAVFIGVGISVFIGVTYKSIIFDLRN